MKRNVWPDLRSPLEYTPKKNPNPSRKENANNERCNTVVGKTLLRAFSQFLRIFLFLEEYFEHIQLNEVFVKTFKLELSLLLLMFAAKVITVNRMRKYLI